MGLLASPLRGVYRRVPFSHEHILHRHPHPPAYRQTALQCTLHSAPPRFGLLTLFVIQEHDPDSRGNARARLAPSRAASRRLCVQRVY